VLTIGGGWPCFGGREVCRLIGKGRATGGRRRAHTTSGRSLRVTMCRQYHCTFRRLHLHVPSYMQMHCPCIVFGRIDAVVGTHHAELSTLPVFQPLHFTLIAAGILHSRNTCSAPLHISAYAPNQTTWRGREFPFSDGWMISEGYSCGEKLCKIVVLSFCS
jgi:hypothetical protein